MPSSCITPDTGPVRPAAVTALAKMIFVAAAIAFISFCVSWNGTSPVIYTNSLAVLVIYATVTGIGLMRLSPAAYKWAFLAPFVAIPLWIIPGAVIAGIVDMFAHGLEGTHTYTPDDLILYCAVASVILLPFWLTVNTFYWRKLRQSEVKDVFIDSSDTQDVSDSKRSLLTQLGLSIFSILILLFLRMGDGRILIHDAAAHGWTSVVRTLIILTQNVNDKTRDGWTPLHYAARYGRVATAKFLIKNDANVNTGVIPPILAASEGYRSSTIY